MRNLNALLLIFLFTIDTMKYFLFFLTGMLLLSCSKPFDDLHSKLPFSRKEAINEGWYFHLADTINFAEQVYNEPEWRTLDLPHDWAIEGPFSMEYASGTGYLPGGIGWYRKKLEIPGFSKDRRYVLMFDGAYQKAEVWVNGHYLGKRPYGYISFYYDLTDYLDESGSNILTVKLDHSIVSDSRWYTGNGIYRNAWLITTNKLFVDTWSHFVSVPGFNAKEAKVRVEFNIKNTNAGKENIIITNSILDPSGEICSRDQMKLSLSSSGDSVFSLQQIVKDPALWSPETPQMYTSVIRVFDAEGQLLDQSEASFGIRDIQFTSDRGFFCNGKSYKLKGVCMHHDYGALGAARTPEAIYPVLKKLKEAGCNAIRTSHNPEDPGYLTMLDTMGFFVMEEAFDEFRRGKKKWIRGRNVGQQLGINAYPKYYNRNGYSDFYDEWAQRDIQDMVRRDRNHPCIIMWSIGNETDYPNDPYQDPNVKSTFDPTLPKADEMALLVKDLVSWIKEIDTTRPVTQALANLTISNQAGVPGLLDVVGYNYQEYKYAEDHENYKERVIYGSENDDNPDAWKAVRDNEFIAGQFLWTGMDYHGEAGIYKNHSFSGGIIDYCGFEKPEYYFRKSVWSEKPMAKLAVGGRRSWNQEMHWNWEEGERRNVTCYTNCEEAELFLNGVSLGRKEPDSTQLNIRWQTEFAPGTLVVKAFRNGTAVSFDTLQTAEKAAELIFPKTIVHSEKFNYDLIQVEARMTDADNILVPDASSLLEFGLEGTGEIIGVCNSDYSSLEPYKARQRKLYKGRCLVIIKTTNRNECFLTVSSAELNKEYRLSFK